MNAWNQSDDPLPRLERYGFLDLEAVERVVRGHHPVSAATIGFLTDLEVLSDHADRAAGPP